jgi:hypothetical protein
MVLNESKSRRTVKRMFSRATFHEAGESFVCRSQILETNITREKTFIALQV